MNQKITQNEKDELLLKLKSYMKRYYENHGKLPTKNIMLEKFNITNHLLTELIHFLVRDGFLKKNYCSYKYSGDEEQKKNDVKRDYIIIVLRIIMLIIGVVAVILSTYYTGIWLEEFLPMILAWSLSFTMVAFSVGVFEVILVFKENNQNWFIVPFVFLWVIVLCFSMMSTVAGQYNARMKNVNSEIVSDSSNILDRKGYEIMLDEEQEIKIRIEEKKKELIPFENIMSNFKTIEDRENNKFLYWDAYEKIKKINKDIEDLRSELENKRNEIKNYYSERKDEGKETEAIEETVQKEVSFYDWVGSIFKVDPKYVEFWLSIIPALFIDIIAPLSVAVSMFLERKKRKQEEENEC